MPVEVGRHYADENWGQRLMTLAEFIDSFVEKKRDGGEIGYLAQTSLFTQIPDLAKGV